MDEYVRNDITAAMSDCGQRQSAYNYLRYLATRKVEDQQ